MNEQPYSNREIDHLFADIKKDTVLIIEQTTKHNHRLSKVERILLILGCVTGTLLVVNGSQLLTFISSII